MKTETLIHTIKAVFPFLLLIFICPYLSPAESFTCPEDIAAFDTSTPSNIMGQFKAGTKLEIGKASSVPGMIQVTFLGPDGKFISALCRAEDLGKAPRTTPPGGINPILKPRHTFHRFEWLEDYSLARKYAKDENKLLLMDFTGSDWCGWCKKLDREVFSTNEFKNYAERNLILLKVDFPHNTPLPSSVRSQNDQLASQYGIQGYPTIIILNSQGQKVGELGYMEGGPSAFIAELKKLQP